MTYTYTHALILIYSKHITVTDIQQQISEFFMNSYNKLIHIFVFIADLYLFKSHVEHIVVLVADLYFFRSLVGVIELILVRRYP